MAKLKTQVELISECHMDVAYILFHLTTFIAQQTAGTAIIHCSIYRELVKG